jgi:hypothetical protein
MSSPATVTATAEYRRSWRPRYDAFCGAHGYDTSGSIHYDFVPWLAQMRNQFEKERGVSIGRAQDDFTVYLEQQAALQSHREDT